MKRKDRPRKNVTVICPECRQPRTMDKAIHTADIAIFGHQSARTCTACFDNIHADFCNSQPNFAALR